MRVESSGPLRRLALVALVAGLAACAQDSSETSVGAPPPEEPAIIETGDAPQTEEPSDNGGGAADADDAMIDLEAGPPSRGPASVEPGLEVPKSAEEAKACDTGGMNDFDWPPPEPSAKVTIPRALLLAGTTAEAQTLGEVGERLENALIEAGYVEFGYQSIGCSGFAMVTRLERIDEEGRPLEGAMRFAPPEAKPNWSLGGYLSRLFYAPPGYYRQIVFAATEKPYDRDDLAPAPTREELDEMLERADVTALPDAMLERPFTRTHKLHALIYEFEKGEADRDVRQVSRLGGAAHVRAAGIYTGLGDGR